MTWQWWATGPEREPQPVGPAFLSQGHAEKWLTESYEELAEAGWTAVSLREADRLVYGPMSLAAE